MNFKLQTITDFDFAVGGGLNEVVRVSEVPDDVTNSEVNLILWLILEHEFGNLDAGASSTSKTERTHYDGGGERLNLISQPVVNLHQRGTSSFSLIDQPDSSESVNLPSYGLRCRRKSASQLQKAKKFAEQILRKAGVNLPFEQLSASERRNLFKQFSASSDLLRHQKFGSILELFEALRSRSKLREEYDVLQLLGRGNFGDVFAVCHRQTGYQYAAKRVSLTLDSIEEMRMTLNESTVLKCLKHQNIVHFHDAWLEMEYDPTESISEDEQEPLKFYVLMDFCYQSLHQWIEEIRKKPNSQQVLLIFKQIVEGLKYIHSNRVLHLDINTKNILFADALRSTIKIGDFGLAIQGDYFPDRTGTIPYSAPEKIQTSKSDIYSMGVTIFEVAENISTSYELHDRLSNNNICTDIVQLNEVLPQLLEKDPNRRPEASHLQIILNTNATTTNSDNHK